MEKHCRRGQPKRLDLLQYGGGEQTWGAVQTGHETAYKTITGALESQRNGSVMTV